MAQEFGTYVNAIVERAADEAQRAGSATIEAEHLLLAIVAEQESTAQRILGDAGLDDRAIRDALEGEFRHSLSTVGVAVGELPDPSRSAKRPSRLGASGKLVFERGMETVPAKKDLRPAHLLLGILRLNAGTVPRALALAGIDRAALTERVRQSLGAPPGEPGTTGRSADDEGGRP